MNSTSNEILPEGYKMTELGPLPEEWEVVRLGEVLDLLRNGITKQQNKLNIGIPISRIETISTGKINTQKVGYISNLSDDEIEKYKVQKGDILLSHINSEPYLGNSAIYENEPKILIHGMNLLLLRVNKNVLSSEYLNFLFNYYREKNFFIKIASRSVNQSSINQAKIKSLPLPLPPLPEQQKIAAVLSAVQEAKEKTQAVIDATKTLKKSMMKHLFTYGPVSPEETENVPLKETEIGKVPEEWEVVRLGEVTEKAKQKDPRRDSSNEFKYVDVSAISNDALKITSYSEFLGKDAPHRARKAIQTDDIIFATVRPYLKRIAIVPENLNGQIVSTAFCVISCKKQIVNPYYIFYTVSLDNFVNSVTENQRGSSYPAVTDKDILNQYVPLPPLPTQQKIASILSAIDAKIEAEENRKKALDDLFKSLLHNLMTAKIRVNQMEVVA